MTSPYLIGTAAVVGASVGDDKFIAIRVKNVASLVQQQGGAAGGIALAIAPQAVTDKVYAEMRNQLAKKFGEQGVIADVQVVSGNPMPAASRNDLVTGIFIGAGSLGVGILAWKYVIKGFFKRSGR